MCHLGSPTLLSATKPQLFATRRPRLSTAKSRAFQGSEAFRVRVPKYKVLAAMAIMVILRDESSGGTAGPNSWFMAQAELVIHHWFHVRIDFLYLSRVYVLSVYFRVSSIFPLPLPGLPCDLKNRPFTNRLMQGSGTCRTSEHGANHGENHGENHGIFSPKSWGSYGTVPYKPMLTWLYVVVW